MKQCLRFLNSSLPGYRTSPVYRLLENEISGHPTFFKTAKLNILMELRIILKLLRSAIYGLWKPQYNLQHVHGYKYMHILDRYCSYTV